MPTECSAARKPGVENILIPGVHRNMDLKTGGMYSCLMRWLMLSPIRTKADNLILIRVPSLLFMMTERTVVILSIVTNALRAKSNMILLWLKVRYHGENMRCMNQELLTVSPTVISTVS